MSFKKTSQRRAKTLRKPHGPPANPGSLGLVLILSILLVLCQVLVWSSTLPPFRATPICASKIKSLIWKSTFHYKNAVKIRLVTATFRSNVTIYA